MIWLLLKNRRHVVLGVHGPDPDPRVVVSVAFAVGRAPLRRKGGGVEPSDDVDHECIAVDAVVNAAAANATASASGSSRQFASDKCAATPSAPRSEFDPLAKPGSDSGDLAGRRVHHAGRGRRGG